MHDINPMAHRFYLEQVDRDARRFRRGTAKSTLRRRNRLTGLVAMLGLCIIGAVAASTSL